MPSIVEGYNYDIFISYRQKDNKGDRWVSEFADALKTELESTFKEEISVYFDINPHDGLRETDDVDASLKEKLKCLIFIPIISRTYCDPKSFAWEHEFKAFVEQASGDQFGLKVKLPNGNVSGRVLPVRIHDLDIGDIKECESLLGSVLRGVEFIYKEPGVNKPLVADDDEKRNLNNTKYKIQVNKVANAIKEIISGLKADPAAVAKEKVHPEMPLDSAIGDERNKVTETGHKSIRHNWLPTAVVMVLLAVAAILLYPKIFRRDTPGRPIFSGDRISVAVMPFQNMTNDSVWDVWQGGIQDNLITSLSNSPDLKVRHKETVNRLLQNESPANYASVIPPLTKIISQKLEVDILISGSISQAGPITRINAQLIDSETDEVYKSFQIDESPDKMFFAVDSLSSMVMDYLVIAKMVDDQPLYKRYPPLTTSPDAYSYYLRGESARSKRDYKLAREMYAQALAIDSNYHHVKLLMSAAFINDGNYEEARKWSDRAYEKIDQMPVLLKILTNSNHAFFHETPAEEIAYLQQYLEIDDKFPGTYYDMALDYSGMLQYEKAIPLYEKSLELFDEMDLKPWWIYNYIQLGYAYHQLGQYKKEEKLYEKADADFPDETSLLWRKAILYLTKRDTARSNDLLRQYRKIYRENAWPEAALERNLGWAYTQAKMPDQAEEAFRKSASLDNTNPFWTYYLAYFLIEQDRNIDEGIELADKALELSQGNSEWIYLDCKGWGLYKKGRYSEALDILQRSWDLRRAKAQYDHQAFMRLEDAKKAVAGQKL